MQRRTSDKFLRTLPLTICLVLAAPLLADNADPEPVTGAFGIRLGETFEPAMVATVIGQEEKAYRADDKSELSGTQYHVTPTQPDENFSAYSVATTAGGIIYAIHAEFRAPDKSSRCDVSKEIAAKLEQKYGKPRGKVFSGAWYAFRDMSVEHYRGIRLYANRCDQGIYEIVYSDDSAR